MHSINSHRKPRENLNPPRIRQPIQTHRANPIESHNRTHHPLQRRQPNHRDNRDERQSQRRQSHNPERRLLNRFVLISLRVDILPRMHPAIKPVHDPHQRIARTESCNTVISVRTPIDSCAPGIAIGADEQVLHAGPDEEVLEMFDIKYIWGFESLQAGVLVQCLICREFECKNGSVGQSTYCTRSISRAPS